MGVGADYLAADPAYLPDAASSHALAHTRLISEINKSLRAQRRRLDGRGRSGTSERFGERSRAGLVKHHSSD